MVAQNELRNSVDRQNANDQANATELNCYIAQIDQLRREMKKLKEKNNRLKAQTNRSKGAYECCICMDTTSDTKKLAVLVPCGHTACEECSPRMQGGPCPTCRRNSTYSVVVQGIYK